MPLITPDRDAPDAEWAAYLSDIGYSAVIMRLSEGGWPEHVASRVKAWVAAQADASSRLTAANQAEQASSASLAAIAASRAADAASRQAAAAESANRRATISIVIAITALAISAISAVPSIYPLFRR